jgi:hypothetical protein
VITWSGYHFTLSLTFQLRGVKDYSYNWCQFTVMLWERKYLIIINEFKYYLKKLFGQKYDPNDSIKCDHNKQMTSLNVITINRWHHLMWFQLRNSWWKLWFTGKWLKLTTLLLFFYHASYLQMIKRRCRSMWDQETLRTLTN